MTHPLYNYLPHQIQITKHRHLTYPNLYPGEDEFAFEPGEIDTREVVNSEESGYEAKENSESSANYASVDNKKIDSAEHVDRLVQT